MFLPQKAAANQMSNCCDKNIRNIGIARSTKCWLITYSRKKWQCTAAMTQQIATSKIHFLQRTQGTLQVKLERNRNNPNASNAIRIDSWKLDGCSTLSSRHTDNSTKSWKKSLARDQACRSHQSAGAIPPGGRTSHKIHIVFTKPLVWVGTYKTIKGRIEVKFPTI